MNKKLITFTVALLVAPMVALAADNFVVTVINNLLSIVVWPLFLGLVIIMFIWAGILYLTARGDPEKFKKANLAVVFAIIGIIVALLGYRIVATVQQFITPAPTQQQPNPDGGACLPAGASCSPNGDNYNSENPTPNNCCTGQCGSGKCFCVDPQGPCSQNNECCSNKCIQANDPQNNTPGLSHCY